MELIRRIALFGCFALGVLFYYFACLDPVVFVEIFDPNKDNEGYIKKYVYSLLAEEEVREIKKRRKKELEEIKAKAIKVDGKDWQDIYNNLITLQKQTGLSKANWNIPEEYKRRLPDEDTPSKIFFFRASESPVNQLSGYLKKNLDQVYLHVPSLKVYLRASYRSYSNDDFMIGYGFKARPIPPSWMLYPYREISYGLFIFGLIAYVFLPYRIISKDALRYPRWRVIVGDFAVFIMAIPFFAMPFFIIRGTVQAFIEGFPLMIALWPVSLLGFYSIKIGAWYASYQILPLDEGIKIATYKGVNLFRYDEMEYFQPVILKPPRWLVVLMWIAALSGRGGAGRAILLSSSQTGTIGIRLKNGRDLLITVTDQMGTTALKGFEKVIEKLRASGVRELDEVREIRSMGFEVMR